MSKNHNHTTNGSEHKINLEQPAEINYWTKKWEISPSQLLEAIKATNSNDLEKIREYLREKKVID